MQDYDDEPVQRPKWIGWVIIIGMILVVLGVLNLGVRLYIGTPADKSTAQRVQEMVQKRPELAQGQAYMDGSDCMRCHGIDRKFVGPSFLQVADRYRAQGDAQAYIAQKIREGSVGVWGNTIMPRHPQVTQEQAEGMAAWILAVPPQNSE
ncbi:MAG: c-type cytochrome [Comamonas sp.]|nr:c-type cytochrome [Candidatus Comamonas equi]